MIYTNSFNTIVINLFNPDILDLTIINEQKLKIAEK